MYKIAVGPVEHCEENMHIFATEFVITERKKTVMNSHLFCYLRGMHKSIAFLCITRSISVCITSRSFFELVSSVLMKTVILAALFFYVKLP